MPQSTDFDFSKLKYTTPYDKIKAVGAPDVPQRILDGLKKYGDSLRDFSAYGFEYDNQDATGKIFVKHRPEDGQVAQVYRMPVDPTSSELEKITHFDLGTGRAISSVTPIHGDDWRGVHRAGGAILSMDVDGKEYFQFWRMWEDTGREQVIPLIEGEIDNKPSTIRIERLTHDNSIKFTSLLVSQTTDFMLFSSTEDGPASTHVYMTRLTDSNTGVYPSSTAAFNLPRQRLTATPAKGRVHWIASSISLDNKYVILVDHKGESFRPLFVLDISDLGTLPAEPQRIVLPGATERDEDTNHLAIQFSRDPATPHVVYLITDAYGDFRAAVAYDVDARTVLHITAAEPSLKALRPIAWDIKSQVVLEGMLYMIANVDGWDKHFVVPLLGARKHEVIEIRFDGPGADSAGISPAFNRKNGRPHEVCYRLASYRSAGGLAHADLAAPLESVQTGNDGHPFIVVGLTLYRQAQPVPPAYKTVAPKVVRFKSFDGLEVPFVYYHPCGGKKRVPVNIEIHGGPSVQATSLRKSRIHWYLLNELECAVLYPNVRGSIGYGKKYMLADDVMLREDSVKDIGALLEYIAEHMTDELDASKIFVSGGSYGGYMTFACLTHYSNKLACGLATCGIADWVSFLSNTAAHRQDNRRREYGDETDPEVRAFLQRISPVSNADKITVPLWISHGDNDTRVPFEQAYFMYDSLVKRGVYAELLVGVTEGHGFRQKNVLEYVTASKILFLERFFAKAASVQT